MKPEIPDEEHMALPDAAMVGPKPSSIDDMEAILARWPVLLKYDVKHGAIVWRRPSDDPRYEMIRADRLLNLHRRDRVVSIDGFVIPAARMVWLLHHGEWPRGKRLVFKDGDEANARIENLEDIPDPPKRRGRGVARCKDRWQAYGIDANGARKHLGVFDAEDEAIAARQAWDDGTWDARERKRKWPKGVAKSGAEWQAYGHFADGRRKHLGHYKTIEEAIDARQAWDAGTWVSWRAERIRPRPDVSDLV
jgi:hypothetical protein